jgi:hypothetical protein
MAGLRKGRKCVTQDSRWRGWDSNPSPPVSAKSSLETGEKIKHSREKEVKQEDTEYRD